MARSYLTAPLGSLAQRSPLTRKVIWGAEYALLSVFWGLSAVLPVRVASAIGHRLIWFCAPRLPKFGHSVRNLSIAFPDKSKAEIATLARQTWATTGRVLAEYPHMRKLSTRPAEQGTDMLVDSEVEALIAAGKPIMCVTAHVGNWELAAGTVAHRLGVPLSVVYSPQQNPYIARRMLKMRQSLGCGLIEKRSAVRGSLTALSKGRSVGMLIDTRADEGEPIRFFGFDAMTSLVPARLALRTEVPVVPVRVVRYDGTRFRVHLQKPIHVDRTSGNDRETARLLTASIMAHYETWITEQPGHWLCSKRRWPKQVTRSATSNASA